MTLVDAQNLLYNWYLKSDVFNLEDDLSSLLLNSSIICDTKDKLEDYRALFGAALTKGYSNTVEEYQTNKFILIKPLSSYPQTIEISPGLAAEIAKITKCDVLNITNRDIEDAVLTLYQSLDKQDG